jgi:F-type H+-transporting ATPase subunit a
VTITAATPWSLRALLLCALAFGTVAAPAHAAGDGEKLDAIGHTMDGNYLDFSPMGKVELPRIFLVRDASGDLGFEVFGSTLSALESGRYMVVAADGPDGAAAHGDGVANADVAVGPEGVVSGGNAAYGAGEPPDNELTITQDVFDYNVYLYSGIVRTDGEIVIDFSITRHLVLAFLGALLLCVVLISLANRYKRGVGRTEAPRGKLQNLMETFVVYVRDEIARPAIGPKADKYLPYILSVFFFILTVNLLGLVPFSATATANITVTAVLALFTFFVTQFAGTKDYWAHIFNPPGIPGFVKVIMIPIEIMGLFIKPFALAVRLFANMTAGHLVILNLIGLIFVVGGLFGAVAGFGTVVPSLLLTLFIYGLEILVAFIQAYVFTLLSAVFIGMAAAEHEHHHDHHVEGHEAAALEASAPLVHGNGQPIDTNTVGTEAALSPA